MCVVIGPLRRVVFGGRETDWERESNGGSDKCGAVPMDSLTHASGRVKTVQGAVMQEFVLLALLRFGGPDLDDEFVVGPALWHRRLL
jgi:hypothetical protein